MTYAAGPEPVDKSTKSCGYNIVEMVLNQLLNLHHAFLGNG